MDYMSVKEAAALWGVSIQMVRRYCKEGESKVRCRRTESGKSR